MCRKEQGMKKTKELILRAVEKTAQKKLIMDSERWPTCLGILHHAHVINITGKSYRLREYMIQDDE